ncbi:hypothetical protein [Priestia megaterium]|uniref:hypothetical protein n=1 Tax=Priestia megaterium TaxID=1404 RepID=UPI0031FDEF1A
MRFITMLNHRCTLFIQGEVTGQDDYGRDIVSNIESMNVPCKLDETVFRAVQDDTGTDTILDSILFLHPDYKVDLGTTILNIVDLEGNPVIQGSFSVQDIHPIYSLKKLHHFEVTLRRT